MGGAVRIGMAVVGLLLLILLIGFFTIDLGRFKPLIVGFASTYLERSISIDGPLSIEIGRKVRVSGESVRVASEDWTEEPVLVSIERFAITMDTWSLLTGVALFDDAEASGIEAHLVVDAQGNDNWTFAGLETEDDEPSMPIAIRRAVISDATLHYSMPALPTVTLAVTQLDLNEVPDQGLHVEFAGAINETRLTAKGDLGTVAELIDGRNVPFELAGDLGEITFATAGVVDDLYDIRRPEIEVTLEGPNAEYLTDILEIDPVTTGPFTIQASATEAEDALTVQVDGTYGEFDLNVTGQITDLQTPDDLSLKTHAEGPSIGTIARLAGQAGLPDLPFKIDTQIRMSGQALVVEQFLFDLGAASVEASASLPNFPGLDGTKAELAASGPQLGDLTRLFGLPGVLNDPFEAELSLNRIASGSVLDARFETNGFQASATGELTDDPALVGSSASVTVAGEDAAHVASVFEAEGVPSAPFAASADLTIGDAIVEVSNGVASLADVKVGIAGRVGLDPLSEATRLRLDTEIANLVETLAGFGFDAEDLPVSDHPLRVAGRVSFAGEDTMQVDDLEAEYGPASVRASLRLSMTDPLAAGEVQIEAESANLIDIVPAAAEYVGTDAGLNIVGGGRWQDDSLYLEDTTLRIGAISIEVKGEVHAPPEIAGTALTLDASLPSLKVLEIAAGQPLPDEPLTVQADLSAEADTLHLSRFDLKLGQSDLSGTAAFRPASEPEDVPELTAELRSTLLDLRPLQALLDAAPAEQEPASVPDDGRLIPDMPLPLDQLREINGSVLLTFDRVLLPNTTVPDVHFDGRVADGALLVERFALGGAAGGVLSGTLQLTPTESGAEFSLTANGANMIVGLPAKTEEARQVLPRYEVRTRLAASGLTVREMAASSRGYLRLVADEGRVALGPITALMGDFAGEVFDTINPFAKKETD
ncbi:MAG: AsmA family protein, partial [Gammaproteobacteria bacterium]